MYNIRRIRIFSYHIRDDDTVRVRIEYCIFAEKSIFYRFSFSIENSKNVLKFGCYFIFLTTFDKDEVT